MQIMEWSTEASEYARKIEYGQWKEWKWVKVKDYLETSHIYTTIFPLLIFANAGVWIYHVDLLSQTKEILHQN